MTTREREQLAQALADAADAEQADRGSGYRLLRDRVYELLTKSPTTTASSETAKP
jgi:hypothetical protein